jgi:hypothetical protein
MPDLLGGVVEQHHGGLPLRRRDARHSKSPSVAQLDNRRRHGNVKRGQPLGKRTKASVGRAVDERATDPYHAAAENGPRAGVRERDLQGAVDPDDGMREADEERVELCGDRSVA